jgi:hypothetical protein
MYGTGDTRLQKNQRQRGGQSAAAALAHFEDNQRACFTVGNSKCSISVSIFIGWVNRALRRLVEEGRIHTGTRQLSTGSEFKPLWHRSYRFYKRAAMKCSSWCVDGSRGRVFYGQRGELRQRYREGQVKVSR